MAKKKAHQSYNLARRTNFEQCFVGRVSYPAINNCHMSGMEARPTIAFCFAINNDGPVKSSRMAKLKVPYARRSGFSDSKSYKSYLECLKNRYNATDGTFNDAIKNRKAPDSTLLPNGASLANPF